MRTLRIALCQVNTVVGDLEGNVAAILGAYESARAQGAQIAVFPELALPGYPAEDLLIRRGFLEDNVEALRRVAAATASDCVAVVGYADDEESIDYVGGVRSANAVAVCCSGQVLGKYLKQRLPNYGPFDEARHFDVGDPDQPLFAIGGARVGLSICEDIWYPDGPPVQQALRGAEIVLNVNASPFHEGKVPQREAMLRERVRAAGCPLVYLNLVGGQDELIFDGGSMVFAADGRLIARCAQFETDLRVVEVEIPDREIPVTLPVVEVPTTPHAGAGLMNVGVPAMPELLGAEEETWTALVLGLQDYFTKNGFTDAVLGLSGGIDSTMVAVLACDALGSDRVHGVSMPSRYSSDHSKSDAAELAERLGMDFRTIPIEAVFGAYLESLEPAFEGTEPNVAEENLQARIRGGLLMGLSNKFGWLLLATGNKSESAVGYCTLYGDTNGAISVIKDVYKTRVYELARWRNTHGTSSSTGAPVFSDSVLDKPPSAELRPDQRDDQSLPPYEVLDPILQGYVDFDRTVEDLLELGHDPDLVRMVARLVDINEFKRRQVPFGLRVTPKAFGRDRRMPITNRYREVRW
jgi:NAD+ synthase (glutamine-hydrolysing)